MIVLFPVQILLPYDDDVTCHMDHPFAVTLVFNTQIH